MKIRLDDGREHLCSVHECVQRPSVTAVLTVLGAVLPFAVLALLVGWPAWRWLRRRQTGVTASPAPGAPAAP